MNHYLYAFLTRIECKLDQLLKGQQAMAITLDDVLAKVTTQGTTVDSVLTLIKGLQDQIAGLGLTPAQQAKVDAIFNAVGSDQGKLEAALSANINPTPPAP